ncbi:hypothetical protein [Christiangramia aquimixticola]|uniref:hypothetical protein n=1 Tax=Christiangramia aquimixticola TaxID=1697558 RepID=UPI003AA949D6
MKFRHPQNLIALTIFLFIGVSGFAQEVKLIEGTVITGALDLDKIHVINITREQGAVTDGSGKFSIPVAETDSLYVSSVQYENRYLVVTKEMIERNQISISLFPKVNELAEVMIDDIQFSGYLANDLAKISIKDIETKFRLQNNLNEFIQKDRELNPYSQPNFSGGIRIDKIAGAIVDKLSAPNGEIKTYNARELANLSIKTVGYEFFREDLGLENNEVCNFLYFCKEDADFEKLVVNENAFVLIEYFESRIDEFRSHRGVLLNATSKNIPG